MNLTRRSALAGAAATAGSTAFGQSILSLNPSFAPASAAAAWSIWPIGGGGYVTGMAVHAASGKFLVKIDVYGAYIGSSVIGTKWRQLATQTSMPSDFTGTAYLGGGTFDVAFDPTDATGNTIYMFYCPYLGGAPVLSTLLKSTDGGFTFIRTGFPVVSQNANAGDASRECGQHIAVDPNNGQIVYCGIQAALYVSLDGGTTFNTVASVPAATSDYGMSGICFDGASGTTGGATNRLLVGCNGHGVYAKDSSGTFSLISGSPTGIGRAKMASDRNYYATAQSAGTLTRISSSNSVSSITASDGLDAFCIDPNNPDRALAVDVGGYMELFSSALSSASSVGSGNGSVSVTATDCPWLTLIGAEFSPGDMVWDPLDTSSATSMTIGSGTFSPNIGAGQNVAVNDILRFWASGALTNWMIGKVTAYNSGTGAATISVGSTTVGGYAGAATGGSGTFSSWLVSKERVWLSTGASVIYIDATPASGTVHYNSQTSGIENMVGYNAVFAPSGPVLMSNEDFQLFQVSSDPRLGTGTNGRGPLSETSTTVEGTRFDCAANDSTYWVANTSTIFTGSGPTFSGYSTNSGIVGNSTNGNVTSFQSWASSPGVAGFIKCSTSLNTVVIPYTGAAIKYTTNGGVSWGTGSGGPTSPASTWNWTGADYLAKDWVTANKFYGTNGSHVYYSSDGGATWTQGAAVTSTAYLVQLRSVPGQSGHLFFTAGARQDGQSTSSYAALKAYHPVSTSPLTFSKDGGVTFSTVPNTAEAISVGFSATPSGGSYPCVAFVGWLSGVYGVWECSAFNPSNLSGLSWTNLGVPLWPDVPTSIDGSPNTAHLYSVSKNGSSFEIYGPPSWP